MYRLKERPPVLAINFAMCQPATFIAALDDKPDFLVVRAAVFRTLDGISRLLLVKRAESDTLPGRWEMPGGGVDATDETIKDGVARELKEETGLTAAWLINEVGRGARWEKDRDGKITKFLALTFVVEVDEIGKLEHAAHSADDASERAAADKQASTPSGLIPITLNDEEHSQYLWVTAGEVREQQASGKKLAYVSRDVKGVMLQAFEVQQRVIDAKACM